MPPAGPSTSPRSPGSDTSAERRRPAGTVKGRLPGSVEREPDLTCHGSAAARIPHRDDRDAADRALRRPPAG